MDNFWNGFTKKAASSMTVGKIMEGMAYGLATRAGKKGKALQEGAEELIDAYARTHRSEFSTPWRESSRTTKEIMESIRELNKETKKDPATASYMLDFLTDSFKNMVKGH